MYLKAKRIFRDNPTWAVYQIKGFRQPMHIKIAKAAHNEMDQESLKNYIKSLVFGELKVKVLA
jgi:hypothetical protein